MKKIALLIAVMFVVFGCKDMPTSDVSKIKDRFDLDTADKDTVAEIDEDEITPDDTDETTETLPDDDATDIQPDSTETESDVVDTDTADEDVLIPDEDINECTNDDTRTLTDVCGFNGNGDQPQKCADGLWANDGACIDPDECENSTWQKITGDVSECVLGQWIPRRVTKQWGTNKGDLGLALAVDSSGNIFVAGQAEGVLDGQTSWGDRDCFVTKWNSDGTKAWTKQYGSDLSDDAYAIAVEPLTGYIFIAGRTSGSFDGNTSAGGALDAFLAKLDTDGSIVWSRQWGTGAADGAYSLALNQSGDIFVTGFTEGDLDGNTNAGVLDIFLIKWNADGTKAWTKQWGTTGYEQGYALATNNAGEIFVSGNTNGALDGNTNLGAYDAFLTKWNANGTKAWTKQWGTDKGEGGGRAIVVDSSGNIFVSGDTSGSLDGNTWKGNTDIFLTKWNANGTKAWTKQWGTASNDIGFGVGKDNNDNILVTGYTEGSLDDCFSAGAGDIFLTKWNSDGTKAWTKQWGSGSHEEGYSIGVDNSGNIFVVGDTQGSLDGNTNAGLADIFLTKWLAE